MLLKNKKIDFYNQTSPVECYKLKIISVYCVIVLILSLTLNSLLLKVFYQNKKLRTSINTTIIALTFTNLVGSILEMMFVIPSNWYCR